MCWTKGITQVRLWKVRDFQFLRYFECSPVLGDVQILTITIICQFHPLRYIIALCNFVLPYSLQHLMVEICRSLLQAIRTTQAIFRNSFTYPFVLLGFPVE